MHKIFEVFYGQRMELKGLAEKIERYFRWNMWLQGEAAG